MKRLFEDPEVLPELREDLQRSMVAGRQYDSASRLPQVLDAMARAGNVSQGATGGAGLAKLAALPTAVKVVALVAVGAGGAALWAANSFRGESSRLEDRPFEKGTYRSGDEAAKHAGREPPDESSGRSNSAGSEPASSDRPSATRREIALVVRIRALLAEDPAAAYELALRTEREFPDGVLVEEREALLIQALAAMGEKEAARQRARSFVEQHASSPMRSAVEKTTEE